MFYKAKVVPFLRLCKHRKSALVQWENEWEHSEYAICPIGNKIVPLRVNHRCKSTDMPDTFRTIADVSEGIYKDKGSKFLSFAEPVTSIEQVREQLDKYRKKYYDARHVCYAYVLGADRNTWRANDDGEPSGTAGRPILGQINSFGLTNILVVVIRYFGGILLGTGGLIVAYRSATADALGNARMIERDVLHRKTLKFPYERLNEMMRLVKETGTRIIKQEYGTECTMECEIKQVYESRFQ